MNIFEKAKKQAPKKKSKANDKVRVKPDSMEQEELFELLEQMADLQKKEKAIKAKLGLLSDELKSTGKEEFSKLFTETGKYPGSFMIEAQKDADIAQVMFVPVDRYIKIDEERAKELKEEFGDEIVTEDTEYGFNKKLLQQYSEEVSEAIMSADIPEKDKSKLITATTKLSVSKGTIEKLNDYGEDVEEVMEKVRPVIQLKGAEVIKG